MMPREAEPTVNERAFILDALHQNTRLDGRALHACREIDISFAEHEYGVADVRMGKTRVMTKISASLASPYPDRKFDGIFTITTELSPLASPAFEVGRQSDLESNISLTLDTLIRRSNALSTESLCLTAGQKVWHLRATVSILSHDGSLLSCASLSLLAALLHFRIPATEIRGGELTIFTSKERDPVPLALLHHPACLCVGLFPRLTKAAHLTHGAMAGMIVDPTLLEEQICNFSGMVIGANKQGEVLLTQKSGGLDVSPRDMMVIIAHQTKRIQELVGLVLDALREDAQRQDIDGLLSKELSAQNDR